MGGKAFHAHEFPEKPEGDGWVASGWGLLKAAVGKKVPEEADLHRRCDERIGMDGVKIPGSAHALASLFFSTICSAASFS
uniref:Uncharacterized protein n=2 Tax=Aegilops tauschii TaxID=37682 RepID=A0A453QTX7_AEGTS